jgi:hypothetical protein
MLVRLAIGTLLAERGGNVPIILDDALVYCDDDRINLMFDALSRAGKYQQIIASPAAYVHSSLSEAMRCGCRLTVHANKHTEQKCQKVHMALRTCARIDDEVYISAVYVADDVQMRKFRSALRGKDTR